MPVNAHQHEPTPRGLLVTLQTPLPQVRILAPAHNRRHGFRNEGHTITTAAFPYQAPQKPTLLNILLLSARLCLERPPGDPSPFVGEAAELSEIDADEQVDGGGPEGVDGGGAV